MDAREPHVREHAVHLAERLVANSDSIREAILKMTADDDLRSAYQLAFTLGEFAGADRNRALAQLAMRDPADTWLRVAIWSSLGSGATKSWLKFCKTKNCRAPLPAWGCFPPWLGSLSCKIVRKARPPS